LFIISHGIHPSNLQQLTGELVSMAAHLLMGVQEMLIDAWLLDNIIQGDPHLETTGKKQFLYATTAD
jgi:hypothetical protein